MSCDVGAEDSPDLLQGHNSYIVYIFSEYEGKHALGPSRLPRSYCVGLKISPPRVAQVNSWFSLRFVFLSLRLIAFSGRW